MVNVPSPAVAFVGRHNSGKTTLMVALIERLCARGFDVGTVKHHHKTGFEFDVPGKDSYRHRAAGATESVVAAPDQIARVKSLDGEVECSQIVASMPGHDIVLVEGYRKSGLPTVEIMRAGNPADQDVARVFLEGARSGMPLGSDFTQIARGEASADVREKMVNGDTVAVVTDIPEACEAAGIYGVPAFGINDVEGIVDYLVKNHVRPHLTVAIQAGGESRRMGRSKATVPFAGRPLISRLVERLAPVADEMLITTNEPDNLQFLFDEFPEVNLRFAVDVMDNRGALPGMLTAFSAARTPYVALVACDMVNASSDLIVAESIALTDSGADAVIPVNRNGVEPFHAVYRCETCLPVVRELVGEGKMRAQDIVPNIDVRSFTRDEVRAVVPQGGCFVNANTPDELRALERQELGLDDEGK